MSRPGSRRLLVGATVAALAVALAGCSSSSGSTGASSPATSTSGQGAGATTTAATGDQTDAPNAIFAHGYPPKGAGGTCDGKQPGQDHISMTYCHGAGQIRIASPDGTRTLDGAVCWINGSSVEIDWGASTAEGATGPMPDVVTTQLPLTIESSPDSALIAMAGHAHVFEVVSADDHLPAGAGGAVTKANVGQLSGTISGSDPLVPWDFVASFACSGPAPSLPPVPAAGG